MTRVMITLVGTLLVVTLATPSHATLNACAAAKNLCAAKKAAALLKCHSKNAKPPGIAPDKFAACIQKAKDKFDGGAIPAKGCFAKIESKFPGECLTTGDVTSVEATIDAFVDSLVCDLDAGSGTCPATPTPTPTIPMPTPTPCFTGGQPCSSDSQCCSLSCNFIGFCD